MYSDIFVKTTFRKKHHLKRYSNKTCACVHFVEANCHAFSAPFYKAHALSNVGACTRTLFTYKVLSHTSSIGTVYADTRTRTLLVTQHKHAADSLVNLLCRYAKYYKTPLNTGEVGRHFLTREKAKGAR